MKDKSDAQLLREYAERECESAFREIVTRHTDFVYSTALRCMRSSDLACDVAQTVFTDLSRKARPLVDKLADNASLAGWLYRSTRFAALSQLRNERRRSEHERQAMEQLLCNSETTPDWDVIRPALDEAMDNLNDEERDALLLRYFKNHDFRAVGLALGVSDGTAQKRVSRAIERLREFFAKRGLTVGASGLVGVISANAVQAAPVGLAVTISTTTALAGTTLPTTATASITKAIAMTTLQKVLICTIVAASVATPLLIQHKALAQARAEQSTLLAEMSNVPVQTPATRRIEDNEDRVGQDRSELERLRRETAMLRARISELSAQAHQLAVANPAQKVTGTPIGETVRLADSRDAGQATPAALLQTQTWAMLHGDSNRLAQLVVFPPETDMLKLKQKFEVMTREATTKGVNALLAETPLSEIRLLEEQPAEDNDRWLVHEFIAKDGSILSKARIRVRLTEAGWKLVVNRDGDIQQEKVEVHP